MPKGAARALRAKRLLVALTGNCLPDGKRKLISNSQKGDKGFKAYKAVQLPRRANACLTASAKESPMPKRAFKKKRVMAMPSLYMSGKRGSNPRPLAWEANALPTELLPRCYICLRRYNFYFRLKCCFYISWLLALEFSDNLSVSSFSISGKALPCSRISTALSTVESSRLTNFTCSLIPCSWYMMFE